MSDDSFVDSGSEAYYSTSEDSEASTIEYPSNKKRKLDDMDMIDIIKERPMTIILVNQDVPENLFEDSESSEENQPKIQVDKFSMLKTEILNSKFDNNIKTLLIDRLSSGSVSDIDKSIAYIKNALKLPVNVKKMCKIDFGGISKFLLDARKKLDSIIYGMNNVKEEIIDFLVNRLYNPSKTGNILALQGPPGVGKTKICRALSEILKIPMTQISFGGMTDSSYLLGYPSTYIGSKPGKIVNILQNSRCMNPIIYLDECFPFEQQVVTEYGPMYIGELYQTFSSGKFTPKVLAYNEEDNTYDFRNITYTWEREDKEMIRLIFRSDTGHVVYIKCTANHKFLTTYRGYIQASMLLENESIITNTHTLIKLIGREKTDTICNAYDIEVEGMHNFVICCDKAIHNMVVHNCDKISDTSHSSEVSSVLVHLLDETQNKDFTDLYLDNIPIDLSDVLFILSFNDPEKIDPIVLNRMKVIEINPLSIADKVKIIQKHILPEINYRSDIIFPESVIEYIIKFRTQEDHGMRSAKKNMGTIVNRLNSYLVIQGCADKTHISNNFSYANMNLQKNEEGYYIITENVVDILLLKNSSQDESWKTMYI